MRTSMLPSGVVVRSTDSQPGPTRRTKEMIQRYDVLGRERGREGDIEQLGTAALFPNSKHLSARCAAAPAAPAAAYRCSCLPSCAWMGERAR